MESTSKLIFEFIAISDHVVNSLVCGIIFTEKFGSSLSFTWLTVNEIPSRETEPFSTINLLNFFGYFTIYMLLFLSSWISDNSPKQSTWPYTKWPPISSPTFKLFSKFILVPSLQNFVVVLSFLQFLGQLLPLIKIYLTLILALLIGSSIHRIPHSKVFQIQLFF